MIITVVNSKLTFFSLLQVMLLGAEEGLFSFRLKEKDVKPVKIQGLTHVHQMSMLPLLNCLIVLAGIAELI
jgi:hypothetical protein